MKHFELLNTDGLMNTVARGPTDRSDAFATEVMNGTFHLDDDPGIEITRICLCSRGADECMHCGRQSKP
ncbi:MAG: hypothetical protein ABTQ29_07090 [Siculibacillus sp.]